MKKSFIVMLFAACVCYADDKCNNVSQNPGIALNSQDVPIFFHDDNPLTGMQSFNLLTTIFLQDPEMQKKIENTIERTLETEGEVIHLEHKERIDMRGFGAGNILRIQVNNVTAWDGCEMPVFRVSLGVMTFVILSKTDKKIFPMVWSINSFLQGPLDASSEGNLTKAIEKLIGEFIQNYQYANQAQTKRPVFYSYK
jgi:hypothetical protein